MGGRAAGEVVLFDKACVDFEHLFSLQKRGVFRVTRARESMACRVVKRRLRKPAGRIVRDEEVTLTGFIQPPGGVIKSGASVRSSSSSYSYSSSKWAGE